MLLLLRMNNIQIDNNQDELVELGLAIASGQVDRKHVRNWIRRHRT